MKKYLRIYSHILKTSIQQVLEYRLNAVVESLYGFFYLGALYFSVHIMFLHTTSIAGWSKNEVFLIFSVMSTMFTLFLSITLESIRIFMTRGVATGEVDMFMVKPVNTQFLISFFYPDIAQFVILLGSISFFCYMFFMNISQITLLSFLLFLLMYCISACIFYFMYTLYGASAFFITKSNQVLELANKLSDFGMYPINMFPKFFQAITFTILPVAYFGYVPTLFLLNKGSLQLFLVSIAMLAVTFYVNQLVWKKGLQSYSSASS